MTRNALKGGATMNHYTAVMEQKGDWWIGWIEEVPGVNCQERSKEELTETLRTTLREALELRRQAARDAPSPCPRLRTGAGGCTTLMVA
jgi:predicted RNase H-like HicB family nuclease